MNEPRWRIRGRWAARAGQVTSQLALLAAIGLAAPARAQAPAKPRTPEAPEAGNPLAPAKPRTPDAPKAGAPKAADPFAPAKPRTPDAPKAGAPKAGDPLAPAKPRTPDAPKAGAPKAADPFAPVKPRTPDAPKAADPLASAAGAPDPLAVLREVDRFWLYEMMQGSSITKLERLPNTRGPVLVRCKIIAWTVPAPLTGSQLECTILGAPDGPEGPSWTRSLIFDAAGVREVLDEQDLGDRSRTGGITFPRALAGTWQLDEKGPGDRRAQVTVREETAPVRGAPRKLWVAEARTWPPANPPLDQPDLQITRFVPGLGPVLLCTTDSGTSFYRCLRLVEAPPTGQPEHIAIASHQAHEPSSLRSKEVAQKIETTYGPAVRRCYQAALAKRPGLRGGLTLSFTVNAVGKMEGLSVTGLDAGVAACVKAAAAAWRFPIPISSFAEPRAARFTIGLVLTPP